ncbi:glycosyltransferase family 2 protein [Agromyces neolithicus]|uniref:Glycosyltransferase 2-like domain-containing protein n=1 Tax=Agromyces neolithicus TaxID=269420 RepID=A0ABN2MC63_9MICO
MPRLSVLMPARNAATHLEAAMRSTLLALPRDAELVVYDDDSSDETLAVAMRVRSKRVRVLHGDERRGPARGMNHLLENSDSEFVARMDADDICHPFRFGAERREIGRGADVVFGTMLHFGGRYRYPRLLSSGRLGVEAVRLSLLLSNPLGHSTMFARRNVLNGGDTYQECPTEDFVLWTTLAARGVPIVRSGTPFASYRHHRGQLTATRDWQARRETENEVVRGAYTALASAVTGWQPSDDFPLRGSWADVDGRDRFYVDELRTRIERLRGSEHDFVQGLARTRAIH